MLNTNVYSKNYFYYYYSDKIPLSEVSGQYAVQFYETSSKEQRQEFLKGYNIDIIALSEKANAFNRIHVKNIEVLSILTSASMVRYICPVLQYSNGMECIVLNRFFVKFKPYMMKNSIDALNNKFGVSIITKYPYAENIYLLKVNTKESLASLEIANAYYNLSEVEYATPDFMMAIRPLDVIPNDYLFDNQWHLGQIKASEAWDVSKGSESIVVAVIDDGVDLLHEDLINRFFRDGGNNIIGADFTTQGDNSPQPTIPNAHGTACAG